jgi:ABC-type multidrug transport system fused ATPase/permease subunit
MNTQEQIKQSYHDSATAIGEEIRKLRGRGREFVTGEIASFLGIVAFIALITISDSDWMKIIEGVMAAMMVVCYIVIRNKDTKNSRLIMEKEQLQRAYQHEEAALGGDFSAFDDGERYIDPHHPFTYDMDIFGKESLYQRINRTVTTLGADRLAESLSRVDMHKSAEETNEYHDAINTLATDDLSEWRMRFISCGVDAKIDTSAILQSLPKLQEITIPHFLSGRGIKIVASLLTIGILASIIAAIYRLVNPMLPIVWIFVNFFLVAGMAGKYLKQMLTVGNKLRNEMQPLMRVVKLANRIEPGQSIIIKKDVAHLQEAINSFEILTNIVETLILRTSDAYKFFADAFCLRGFFLVNKFSRWRSMATSNLTEWIGAVSELDTLVSMAQMRYDHPEAGSATIINNEKNEEPIYYEAKGLWHPFLGAKAVRNDFDIRDGNFYIVTGANMAGKSTFLRALGVNYILAMNGMPVFAESLTVSRFKLFSSMRTSDDLSHGISYFNAELLRLKQLLKYIDPSPLPSPSGRGESPTYDTQTHTPLGRYTLPEGEGRGGVGPSFSHTLLILDEILKGTNSLDKLNGSRMFLRAITDKPVAGVIATHDLELAKMEQESPQFHNWCFEIALGTDVTYPYKITPGVAKNQNATYLLSRILSNFAEK